MNKPRQRRHAFYYEKLKRERDFKQAVKAPPINIEMLTKGKLNDTTHIECTNAAEPKRG